MRQDVIARQVRGMKDAGLDAVLSISPENFAYVTGFLSPTAPLMRWRHAMALVTADGATGLIVVDMEASTIRAKSPEGDKIREALVATDLPGEQTIMPWKRVKFDEMGQNNDADPVLLQYVGGKFVTISPPQAAVAEAVWPMK